MSNRTFVAGHRGLVGSALVRTIQREGLDAPILRSRDQLDLTDSVAVRAFFRTERPAAVLLAAARVGGILANSTYRWDFLYENLLIQNAVLGAALETDVERVVFFGSSCIYPKHAPQPISEEALLTGPLEPTNEPYAIAKIAGVKLIEAANAQYGRCWVSIMPTNLYGPSDNFSLEDSHVLPAMIRKFHEAKLAREAGINAHVTLWGQGTALREFLHVDDLARAALHLMQSGETGLFNVGSGVEMTINDLASSVRQTVGYDGPVEWDRGRPDGTPRKLIDSSKIRATGWTPQIAFAEGLASTYAWYVAHSGT